MQHVNFGARVNKAGLTPESMVYTGDRKVDEISIEAILYNSEEARKIRISALDELNAVLAEDTCIWLNINGLHDTEIILDIGRRFGIDNLFLEDILNVNQRPKIEFGDEYLFYVLRMIQVSPNDNALNIEQVSFIHGPNYLLTFQESEGDVFESVRRRILKDTGRIRKRGVDFLVHALFDMIIDFYFVAIDNLREEMAPLEDRALDSSYAGDLPATVRDCKNQLIILRRSIAPLREVIDSLLRYDGDLWQDTTTPYLNDLRDHLLNVTETLDSYRESLSGVLELNLAILSKKMNDIMRILTVIATIFIPLTFAAGIYGMNFDNMPELKWHFGYFIFLGICATTAFTMLGFFRWKKWL